MQWPGAALSLRIRSPSVDDSRAVSALLAELGYAVEPGEMKSRIEDHSGTGLRVADHEGNLLGLIAFEDSYYFPSHTTLCRITALVVPPASRRLGVARKLVESVVSDAKNRGCSGVEVTTALSREDAHRFYDRAGFERTSYRYYRHLEDD